MSVRIHQLAKDTGFKNEALLHLLKNRSYEVKSASSTVDNTTADKLREDFKLRAPIVETETHVEPPSQLRSSDNEEAGKPKSL